MFQFPGSASSYPMYSDTGTIRLKMVGSPIRISSDQSFTYSSPRRFAVRRVLLRLLVPRHSPCALSNLTNLISGHLTMSFIKYGVYKDSLTSIKMIALCVFCIARFSFQRTIAHKKSGLRMNKFIQNRTKAKAYSHQVNLCDSTRSITP